MHEKLKPPRSYRLTQDCSSKWMGGMPIFFRAVPWRSPRGRFRAAAQRSAAPEVPCHRCSSRRCWSVQRVARTPLPSATDKAAVAPADVQAGRCRVAARRHGRRQSRCARLSMRRSQQFLAKERQRVGVDPPMGRRAVHARRVDANVWRFLRQLLRARRQENIVTGLRDHLDAG